MSQSNDENLDLESSTESQEEENQSPKTVPFDRFSKVNSEKNQYKSQVEELQKQLAEVASAKNRTELNGEVSQMKREGMLGKDFKIPENMPFDEAIQLIIAKSSEIAKQEALESINSAKSKEEAEVKRYEKMIDDGFDSLRELGHNVTKKEEGEMIEMISSYGIQINSANDFSKVYDLYKKTQGKAKNTYSFTGNARTSVPATKKLDYSKPLSKVMDEIRGQLLG